MASVLKLSLQPFLSFIWGGLPFCCRLHCRQSNLIFFTRTIQRSVLFDKLLLLSGLRAITIVYCCWAVHRTDMQPVRTRVRLVPYLGIPAQSWKNHRSSLIKVKKCLISIHPERILERIPLQQIRFTADGVHGGCVVFCHLWTSYPHYIYKLFTLHGPVRGHSQAS